MLNFELNIQQDSLEKIKVFFQKLRMLSKKLHQIQYPNSTEFLCAINHICAALTNLNLEHLAQTQPNLENLLVNIKKQKLVLADLNKKIAQVEQQQAQSFFSKFFGLFKEKDALLQVRHNMKQQLAQEIEKRETELSHQLLSIIFNETNQSLDKLFPFYVNSIMAPLEQNQQLANSLDMNLLSILLLVKKQFFYFFTFAQTLQGTMQTVDLIKNVPYFAWTSVDTNHRSYLKRGFDFFMEQSPISSATSAMADWFFLSFDAFLENFDFFYINMYSHKMIPIELQKNVHTSLTEFYISQNFSFLYPLAPIIMEVVDKISEENEQIMPKDALELFSKLGLLAFSPNNFTQPNTVIILQLYESIKTKLPDCYFKNSLEYKTKFFTIFIKFSKNILATLDHPLVKEIWDKKKVEQLANAIHVAKNMNLHHEADIQEGMKLLYRALYQLQHTHKEESNQLVPYVTNLLQYSIYELNTIFYSNSALEFNPNFPEAVVNILFELGIRKLNALINTNMDLITKINHSMEEEKTIVYAQPFFQQTSQAVRNIDKILFLYSTGGSGHEQAMRAHVQIE
ncbi:MAG TPA: hypothetical protein VFP93_03340, partial [Gammaproteobacteria bacterium]|nr:hypothetical protein [Gammaproteobacteria bacterium]